MYKKLNTHLPMIPTLSVVMPVFNQERYLAETIESVLVQTFRNFEFLILDDGSTDNSARIIQQYAARDNRIRAYHGMNRGKCEATNILVGKATGKWCAFLDADDVMISNRLERQQDFHLKFPNLDALSCHCIYINEHGSILGQQRYPYLTTIEDCKRALLQNQIVHCSFTGLMVLKDAFIEIGGLRNQCWPCEDLDFVNRFVDKGKMLVIMQESLMKYRVHSSSVTASEPWHIQQKTDYTRHCIFLRRAGRPEQSFEEYLRTKPQDTWWSRFRKRKQQYSVKLQRKAGFEYYSKNYISFLCNMVLATACSPSYITATIKNRIRRNGRFKKMNLTL